MRKTTWVLAVAAVIALTGLAQAQNRQPRRGGGAGMMGRGMGASMLLANEGVQKELKLTDEQKEKAKEFAQSQGEKMRELRPQGGERPDQAKVQAAMKTIREADEKFVKETLKPEQQKRLHQIQIQVGGVQSLAANEEVQKELKLTDEQKEKLKTLAEDLNKDRRELFQGGFNQETAQKMQALNKEYMTKATGVLTADQKKTWKDMTGEPFELQMMRRRGGDR